MDIGLRNYLLGFRNRDSGHALENVVYFELLRRGYDVAIGKIGDAEIDFIAAKADEKLYVQVTESMMSEDVRRRELAPLQKIRDNYEKIVLSLEPGLDSSYDGNQIYKLTRLADRQSITFTPGERSSPGALHHLSIALPALLRCRRTSRSGAALARSVSRSATRSLL